MTAETRATNVIEALSRVIRDLPGIGKGGRADPKQGGYAYRGIEQITVAAQPLLAEHGVVFTPHKILDRTCVDIEVNGKPWTDERLTVLWRVYGPGGRDDFIELETPAVGRDNSDKGSNKCMTQAFKYALIQTLCVSDSKDDADGTTAEADPGSARNRAGGAAGGSHEPYPASPARPASEKQRRLLESLIEMHTVPDGCAWPLAEDLSMRDCSGFIDELKQLPEVKNERVGTVR